jgi:hypothetical protein
MAMITGKLEDILGNVEGGSVEIALCGYGNQVPRANGQALISKPFATDTAGSDGTFTQELTGNDEIAPAGTYYTVTVKDKNGDIVQVNAYLFLGDTTYDLDVTDPFDPSQPTPPLPPLIINQLLILPFSATPDFPGDQYLSWAITLTGDVTSSSLSGIAMGNLYTFVIQQDSTGNRIFTWPLGVQNAMAVDPAPNSISIQTFIALASGIGPLLPIGPGTYFP